MAYYSYMKVWQSYFRYKNNDQWSEMEHACSQYSIHHKYADTLNVLFVAFTYGPAIPFLFVLVLLYLTLEYYVEKFMIAYYYARPPVMTIEFSRSFMYLTRFAPFLFLINAEIILNN